VIALDTMDALSHHPHPTVAAYFTQPRESHQTVAPALA
jgi:hypothetical protein